MKPIFLEISQVFLTRSFFSRIFFVLPIWTLLFPGVPAIFWFESCFSRTTGNGLETDELGLAGSLACRGLCCLCCLCSHSLAKCHLKPIFLEISQVFLTRSFFSRIFFVLPIWTLLFPGVPAIFWFESCFSRTTGNGLETDELGLAGSLACRGLCCLCCLCSHSLARCHLKPIFLEISQVFLTRSFFSRIFFVLPIWTLLFPGVPAIFWFESCFSRTTGNGLETDELGLAGSLACRGLCCLCCLCSHSLARCHLKPIFLEISQVFLTRSFFSRIFFVLPIWTLLFPGVPAIFWFESCFSRTTGNGLETDELGLAGSLACRGLCCLCCLCSHSLARCHLKPIFLEISQVFLTRSFFSRIFFVLPIWTLLFPGVPAIFLFESCFSRTTGNGLETDELGLAGSLACRGLCCLCCLCSHSLARCHLKPIFLEISQVFLTRSFFSRIFFVLPIWTLLFPGVPAIFLFESCFSRTTGNGLETDELGLAGSLACRGLCCLCCLCSHSLARCQLKPIFLEISQVFLTRSFFSRIFFVLPIWTLLFPGAPAIFWFESCFSRTTGNGLETDELGLAGSLACRGLCCLCCLCSHSLARCHLKPIFLEISQVFLTRSFFSRIFFVLPIWTLLFPGVPAIFLFESCFSRTTGNGLETDELGLAGSLACRGLCCLCCLCSHSLARCHLKPIFLEISQVFLTRSFFSRIFFVLPIWTLLFPGVPAIFWFESCFSRTTGNGLETDELGLAGSLACRRLCCLCCLCSHSLARCHLKPIFLEISQVFLTRSFFSRIFFVLPIWTLLFPGVPAIFWFESCFSRTTGNGLETDELGLAGSLACRGLCCLCCLCSHSLAKCHLKPIFLEISQVFLTRSFFLGFSLFFLFERCSFQEFLQFSGLKAVLVGLLAMVWRLMSWDLPDHLLVVGCAVCAVCAPIPWLSVIWNLFS